MNETLTNIKNLIFDNTSLKWYNFVKLNELNIKFNIKISNAFFLFLNINYRKNQIHIKNKVSIWIAILLIILHINTHRNNIF
jgi:hypothetical protein